MDDTKRFATLRAELAIRGFQLLRDEGGFLVARWEHARHFADLDQVERFIQSLGRA